MAAELHLGEAITIFFAALTLIATIAIALFAVRLSSDFTDITSRLGRLEDRSNEANEAEARFRFESEMLLNLANVLYRTNTLFLTFFRLYFEKNLPAEEERRDIVFIFLTELCERKEELFDSIDLFRVLVDPSDENVKSLVEKRPNKATLDFLGNLCEVAPREEREQIKRRFHSLMSITLGIDSSRWTGRIGRR